jgi:hypothetical protein
LVTTGDLLIAGLAWLLLGRRASAATKSKAAASTLQEVSSLQARANQPAAQAWIPDLENAGASHDLAAALARWIGIESSGNPSKPSKAGEYGLLQILPSTARAALTPGEWLQLKDPTTARSDQAKIALKQFMWHQDKARAHVAKWPGNGSWDSIFYAKLHHQRPADLVHAGLTGDAHADARALVQKWKNDPKALHRLAAASVVTWGTITP